jgi:hypothetical protein
MTRGWFGEQYEGGHCDALCPFVRDCPSCAFRGGDSSAAQQDSARETGQETSKNGKVGDSKTAPDSARTPPEPRPTEASKPTGRTCIQ